MDPGGMDIAIAKLSLRRLSGIFVSLPSFRSKENSQSNISGLVSLTPILGLKKLFSKAAEAIRESATPAIGNHFFKVPIRFDGEVIGI